MESQFTSDNPIIQKCMDVLKNPKVKIDRYGDVLYAYLRGNRVFGVGSSGILFIQEFSYYDDKKYNGMSFEDIHKIWDEAERLCAENLERQYGEKQAKILGYLDTFIDKKSEKTVDKKQDEILPSRWDQFKQFLGFKLKKRNALEY